MPLHLAVSALGTRDNDGAAPYYLQVVDPDGSIVETVRTNENDGLADRLLPMLYEAARRNALNIDQVVDDILKDLE